MYEMPYRYSPGTDGRVFSPVLCRMVKLSPAMAHLVKALDQHGHIDTIRDGGTVGTVVALIDRGILREGTPRSHGKGSGHHYPASTPAQVWDEAHGEYRQREEDHFDEVWDAAEVEGCQFVTPAQAHQVAVREAAKAYNRGDIDDDGNWQEPVFPKGTPEYAAYEAELKTELDEWAAGETPYGYPAKEQSINKAAITAKRIDSLMDSGVPEVEQETPEQRATRHALDRPLIEAFRAMIPNPHPMENCGPLLLKLAPGDSCPTCGTVPPITPAEQRTGVSDVQHAIADEIAALRRNFGAMPLYDVSQMLARLDRIAALAPQRATDGEGWGIWQHSCGHPQSARRGDGICDGCGTYSPDGEAWRALYTVAGQ